jgi:hypothetical protein
LSSTPTISTPSITLSDFTRPQDAEIDSLKVQIQKLKLELNTAQRQYMLKLSEKESEIEREKLNAEKARLALNNQEKITMNIQRELQQQIKQLSEKLEKVVLLNMLT